MTAFDRDIRLVELKMQLRFLSHCNHMLLEKWRVGVWIDLVVPSLRGVKLGREGEPQVMCSAKYVHETGC